jgi:gluconate 5-dehydrogenase
MIAMLDMAISDYKQVIDVDLVVPLIISKRVAPKMIEKRRARSLICVP